MSRRRVGRHVPVLVAGAGPAGLASAITLAEAGVETLVVDSRAERSRHPRATAISLRSMELLRRWGLEQEILAGGVDVEWLGWEAPTLAAAGEGGAFDVGMPTRDQSALLSPTRPASVPQDHLESVLLGHLGSLPAARISVGAELTTLRRDQTGVDATIVDDDGMTRRIRADYLVAADGAHSSTRARLGIEMTGCDRLQMGASVTFRAPAIWEALGDLRYGLYSVTHPDSLSIFLPAGRDDRWLFGFPIVQGGPSIDELGLERLTELIRIGAGIDEMAISIESSGFFGLAAGISDRFRHGRTFLVGDAAHRVTPRGGTGMNMALRGGFDLGWKLAWAVKGWGDDDLLDSYESERRPVAIHNIRRSTDELGSRRASESEVQVDLGARLPHAWIETAAGRVSTLDLIGPGLTLITSDATWVGNRVHSASGPPVSVRVVDAGVRRELGIPPGQMRLYRPDGVEVQVSTVVGNRVEPSRSSANAAPRMATSAAS